MTENYEDIINLPHHQSEHHPRMTMANRAAQFAPFAALPLSDITVSPHQEEDELKKIHKNTSP